MARTVESSVVAAVSVSCLGGFCFKSYVLASGASDLRGIVVV